MAFGVLDGAARGADGNGDDEAPRYSDGQIAYELQQAERSTTVTDICGLPSQAYVLREAFRSTWTWSAVALAPPHCRHVGTRLLIIDRVIDRGQVPNISNGRNA